MKPSHFTVFWILRAQICLDAAEHDLLVVQRAVTQRVHEQPDVRDKRLTLFSVSIAKGSVQSRVELRMNKLASVHIDGSDSSDSELRRISRFLELLDIHAIVVTMSDGHFQIIGGKVSDLTIFNCLNQRDKRVGKGTALVGGGQPTKQAIDWAPDFKRLSGNQRGAKMNIRERTQNQKIASRR